MGPWPHPIFGQDQPADAVLSRLKSKGLTAISFENLFVPDLQHAGALSASRDVSLIRSLVALVYCIACGFEVAAEPIADKASR
jgi:hypothetical protein